MWYVSDMNHDSVSIKVIDDLVSELFGGVGSTDVGGPHLAFLQCDSDGVDDPIGEHG